MCIKELRALDNLLKRRQKKAWPGTTTLAAKDSVFTKDSNSSQNREVF